MTQNQKRLRLAALALIVVMAVFGTIRSQFFSAGSEPIAAAPQSAAQQPAAVATPGSVTMIDLGATECVPCKMMAPILEELKKEYAGRAEIIFIDVWKDPPQAKKYGIRAIPTQIFFDAEGKEVLRHVGFMDKKRIVEILTRLGVS